MDKFMRIHVFGTYRILEDKYISMPTMPEGQNENKN